jgi:cell division septation protein DedD
MPSGGKRNSAGDRVLESKHVIGLFLLMLLFSGVFFSLGYVMGRNQYEGQVRAMNSYAGRADSDAEPIQPKPVPPPKKSATPPPAANNESDSPSANSDWEFYGNSKSSKTDPHLEPAPKSADAPPPSRVTNSKPAMQPQPVSAPVKSSKSVPAPPPQVVAGGAYILQVAALLKQEDALAVASTLQKKQYICYVQTPLKDKYYRVQVGPFKDRKTADAAKQGLENEGFKAFYVKR